MDQLLSESQVLIEPALGGECQHEPKRRVGTLVLVCKGVVGHSVHAAVLSEFTTLEHLDLGLNHGVGDRTLAVVAKLPNLKTLLLDGTSVTDKGLIELVQCQRLERLGLELCRKIRETDLIQQLCRLPNLWELGLSGTGIEETTIRELRKEFPHVEIMWSFGEQK